MFLHQLAQFGLLDASAGHILGRGGVGGGPDFKVCVWLTQLLEL